jgi:hypothetical protein
MSESKNSNRKGCFRKIFVVFTVFLLVVVASGWIARGWIIEKGMAALEEKLVEAKVYATYGSPGFRPGRGLVIENLVVYADKEKTTKLMGLGNVGVKIPLNEILKGVDLGGEISVSKADVTIYPAGEEPRTIKKLSVRVGRSARLLALSDCEMFVNGLLVKASGALFLPDRKESSSEEGDAEKEKKEPMVVLAEALPKIARVFDALAFEAKKAPVLTVLLTNEADTPDKVVVGAKLEGEYFAWQKTSFRAVNVSADWTTGKAVELPDVKIALGGSVLITNGQYDPATKALVLAEIKGKLNPVELLTAFGGEAGTNVVFSTPLKIDSGSFEMSGGKLEEAKGNLVLSDAVVTLKTKDTPMVLSGLKMNAHLADNILTLTDGTVDLMGGAAKFTGEIPGIKKPEACKMNLNIDSLSLAVLGEVTGAKAKMKGNVDVRYAGEIGFKDGRIGMDELNLALGGTQISGKGAYDIHSRTLQLASYSGSVDPMELVSAFGGSSGGPVTFIKPWKLSGSDFKLPGGKIEAATTRFTLSGADLSISGMAQPLKLADVSFKAALAGNALTFSEGDAQVLGGGVAFNGRLPSLSKPEGCEATIRVSSLSMAELAAVTGVKGGLSGQLEGSYAGVVKFGKDPLSGSGEILVNDGEFYAVPVFDELFGLLNSIAPNLSKNDKQDVEGAYAIAGSAITIEKASMRSTSTEINAKGQLDYASSNLAIDATANFRGAVGVATGLVSKLLEISAKGTISEPTWKFKNLPGVKTVLNAATGVVETGAAVTGAAVKTGEIVTDAVKETADKLRPGIIFKKKKE